jgi:hypothetical protein
MDLFLIRSSSMNSLPARPLVRGRLRGPWMTVSVCQFSPVLPRKWHGNHQGLVRRARFRRQKISAAAIPRSTAATGIKPIAQPGMTALCHGLLVTPASRAAANTPAVDRDLVIEGPRTADRADETGLRWFGHPFLLRLPESAGGGSP